MVLHDIFGFGGGRTWAICDELARHGFHVALPDVYEGTNLPAQGGFGDRQGMRWLKGRTEWPNMARLLDPAFETLSARGVGSVGALGFCWGAYGVFKLSAAGRIKAGVACHPSLKVGRLFFRDTEEAQAEAAACPMALLLAGNDDQRLRPLKGIVESSGNECVLHNFPEMTHGWVPRGDTSDPAVARDVGKAISLSAAFLHRHL